MPFIRTLKDIDWDLSYNNFLKNIEKIPPFLKSNSTIVTIIILYSFIFVPVLNAFYILQDCVAIVQPTILTGWIDFPRYPLCINNQLKSTIAGFVSISLLYLSVVLAKKVRKENRVFSLILIFEFGYFLYEAFILSWRIPTRYFWSLKHNLPLYLIISAIIIPFSIITNYLFFYLKKRRERNRILNGEILDLY